MFLSTIFTQIEGFMADSIAKSLKVAQDASSSGLGAVNISDDWKNFSWDQLVEKVTNSFIDFGIRVIAAIVVFYVGKFIIGKLHNILKAMMLTRNVDRSLSTFTLSFVRISLMVLLIISVIGILGIETSSFIAIFASAGVAIGMALSGTLQNFAGGVLILFLKPYKIGDYIEFGEYAGFVREIQIFHTIITTRNNERVVIPNGGLSTGTIKNITKEPYRRIEWMVSVSYGDDVNQARDLVLGMLTSDERVIKDFLPDTIVEELDFVDSPKDAGGEQDKAEDGDSENKSWWYRLWHRKKILAEKAAQWREQQVKAVLSNIPKRDCRPVVYLNNLNNSSVDLLIRAWVKTDDYWDVYYEINERIYREFPLYGIRFPFPQMDLHIKDGLEGMKQ